MTTESRLYTIDDVAVAAKHYENWELVDGRIVSMTAPQLQHALVIDFLVALLRGFVMSRGVGRVLTNLGVVTRIDPDSLRIPDILMIGNDRLKQVVSAYVTVPPELVIEVKSPDNSWRELHDKALEYLAAGVDQVWNVDTRGKRVRVYRSATDYVDLGEDGVIACDGLLTGLVIPVREIIASAN